MITEIKKWFLIAVTFINFGLLTWLALLLPDCGLSFVWSMIAIWTGGWAIVLLKKI